MVVFHGCFSWLFFLLTFLLLTFLCLTISSFKIYFVERTGRIYECNVDGSNMEVNPARPPMYKVLLVNRPSNVRLNSITLDTTSHTQRRKHALYWTESNTNAVMRSNIDGRKMQQVAGLNGRCVLGITCTWECYVGVLHGSDRHDKFIFLTDSYFFLTMNYFFYSFLVF
jgi:hypothetical protein